MRGKKRVTIYDIARLAGVTTATVSRVINGKHGISKETRESVIAVMKRERYFPSPAASGLRKKSTREIGILSPFFIGDFFLKIFESLHRQLKDFDLILYNAQTPANRREVIDRIIAEEKLCALIVASTPILLEEEMLVSGHEDPHHHGGGAPSLLQLRRLRPPDRRVQGGEPPRRARASRHRHHRGKAGDAPVLPHRQGEAEGVPHGPGNGGARGAGGLRDGRGVDQRGRAGQRARLLGGEAPPTAIFATSDVQAAGVLMAARDLGVRVPQELSVVGYDNIPFAEFLSLTTMWQHHDQLARNAATLLLEELRSGHRAGERVILQPELVVRSSTAAPARIARAARAPRKALRVTGGARSRKRDPPSPHQPAGPARDRRYRRAGVSLPRLPGGRGAIHLAGPPPRVRPGTATRRTPASPPLPAIRCW